MYKSTTHKEKYYHFRHNPMFLKLYDDVVPNGGTVFCREEQGTWYMALSICSRDDQFCRARGRQEARRKYFLGDRLKIEGVPTYEVAEEFYDDIVHGYTVRRHRERHHDRPVQLQERVPRPKVRPRPARAQPGQGGAAALHSLQPPAAYDSAEGVCGGA